MKNITLITAKAGLSFELVHKPVRHADLGPQIVVIDGDFRVASYCLSTFRENVAKKQGVCITAGKFEKYRAIESDTLAQLVAEADALLSGTPPPPASQGTPTPGPWTALLSSGDEPWMVAAAMPVARIPNYDDRAAANAALIAAAPELLAALEALDMAARGGLDQSATHDGLTNCAAIAKARAAIAKAKRSAQ